MSVAWPTQGTQSNAFGCFYTEDTKFARRPFRPKSRTELKASAGARGDRQARSLRIRGESGQRQQPGGLVEVETGAERSGCSSNDAAAHCRIEGSQTFDFEGNGAGLARRSADCSAACAHWLAGKQDLGQDAREFRLPASLVLAGELGQVGQRLIERRVELAQDRQQVMPDAVAGELLVGVRGIGAPGLHLSAQVFFEFSTANLEQRTQNFAGAGSVGQDDDWVDAAQALGPCAAQQFHQDSLGLIVQSVRREDGISVALRNQACEIVVAESARSLFDGLGLAGLAAERDAVGNTG